MQLSNSGSSPCGCSGGVITSLNLALLAEATGTITGHVVVRTGSQTAPTTVVVVGTSPFVTTDRVGNFSIPGVAGGPQTLKAATVAHPAGFHFANTVYTAGGTMGLNFSFQDTVDRVPLQTVTTPFFSKKSNGFSKHKTELT